MLHDRVVAYLKQSALKVGTALWTDAELVEATGLSRSTVRRALDALHREGWIHREVGRGTFAGARVAMANVESHAPEQQVATRSAVRVGVLTFGLGDPLGNWYAGSALQGMSMASTQQGVAVELLGHHDVSLAAAARRFEASRPDVYVSLSVSDDGIFLLRDAQRLGIPSLAIGSLPIETLTPVIVEDNEQGMKLAIRHLADHGHRRIGIVFHWHGGHWVFERHQAFHRTMQEHGFDVSERSTCWLPAIHPLTSEVYDRYAAQIDAFVQRERPTAIIAAAHVPMIALGYLAQSGRLDVPGQVSVLGFDQYPGLEGYFAGRTPSGVHLPLSEMGATAVAYAAQLHRDQEVPQRTSLPCKLVIGHSVQPARRRRSGAYR